MPKQPFDFSVPPEMRTLAQQSVEQARKAFDGFMSAAGEAAAGMAGRAGMAQGTAQTVARQAMSFAEQNVANSLDLAQKLLAAKSLDEVMQLQADFVRRQMETLATQARRAVDTAADTSPDGSGKKGG